jgi:regulator of sigma E protease
MESMSYLVAGLGHVLPFLVGVTILVFIHELGHYLAARWAGVRVETFSIGFGPELFGWNDRHGTRWRVSAIPFGGYVMMFGDADATSTTPGEDVSTMSEADRAVCLHHKPVYARAIISAAGPFANFVFAIAVSVYFLIAIGQAIVAPVVEKVIPGSVAAAAGLQSGDRFVEIDGRKVTSFDDVIEAVLLNTGDPMRFVIGRGDETMTLVLTPGIVEEPDGPDNKIQHRQLGVVRPAPTIVHPDPATAIVLAVRQTWDQSAIMLRGIGQIITGARSSREMGGIVSIGKVLSEGADRGIETFVGTMAGLSISLGLINLFPIPVLDGGHLLFYAAEAVLGRPLGRRTQELGFKVGLALVLTLMVFANGNDLVHRVIPFLRHLFT